MTIWLPGEGDPGWSTRPAQPASTVATDLEAAESEGAVLDGTTSESEAPSGAFEPVPDERIVAFAREQLGFALTTRQAAILSELYRDGIRVGVLRLGRRSGKGRMAAVVAVYEATVNADVHLAAVPPGEQLSIVIVATSQRQARIVHRYVRSFLSAPALAPLVVRESADEIELTNGIVIATVPCHAAGARGLAVPVLVLDEAAWFQGVDGSPLDVGEIWAALYPATAQFPQGRALVLSTPRWASGWFAELCRNAAAGDPTVRHWHATTAQTNPLIPASFLDAERAKDPAAFRREYEASFESGIGAVFDAESVRAAVRERGDIAPRQGLSYTIAVDPAFTGDTFTAVVGHRDTDRRIVVDLVRGWRGSRAAPVLVDATLDEIAALSRGYARAVVLIDQYAAQPIRQGLRTRGVSVRERPWTNEAKVDAATAVRQALYAARLDLPAHRELVSELLMLEQRPLPSGRPRIAAPAGQRDDYATALMALVAELSREQRVLRAY